MLRRAQFETEYQTGSEADPHDFLKLGLTNSSLYRRASGYFSGSIFDLFKSETLQFAKSGGQIQLMCSPVLTQSDLDQISKGYEAKNFISNSVMRDLDCMVEGDENELRLSFLASLIHQSVLDIKLIFLENGNGIFHDKSGYFLDVDQNIVSFSGSANESSFAFSGDGNFERLSVFVSWVEVDKARCESTKSYVDRLWAGDVEGLEVLKFPEVARDFLSKYARTSFDEFDKCFKISPPKKSRQIKKLMPHQKDAINNWISAGRRGILKHATGSGKTITAIDAIRSHIKQGLPALVVVPSKLLLEQWYQELISEIEGLLVVRCGTGHAAWRKKQPNLRTFFRRPFDGIPGNVVLAVNDTASSDEFVSQIENFENILLVADEVHSLGSHLASRILTLPFAYRLGLSATPERYGDPEGTDKLFNFFEGIVQPEISLADAVASGRLVKFDYFPMLTGLTAAEEDDWKEATAKIVNYLRFKDRNTKKERDDKILTTLLIKRSRIAKKASAKVSAVTKVLNENFCEGQHWLVYCEDTEQLDEINLELLNDGIQPYRYLSSMGKLAGSELAAFTTTGGILLSVKCLDEGVDIPCISHAIIAASSQNPRQFIQRRGRVLRRSKEKLSAVIFDCIVAPSDTAGESKFDGLVLNEIRRAIEFARTARNAVAAESTLRSILIRVGSTPDDVLAEVDGDVEDE